MSNKFLIHQTINLIIISSATQITLLLFCCSSSLTSSFEGSLGTNRSLTVLYRPMFQVSFEAVENEWLTASRQHQATFLIRPEEFQTRNYLIAVFFNDNHTAQARRP